MARILVIDDNELVRDLLRDVLEDAGHAVAVAGEGGEGIRLLAGFPADLVITDLLMPGQEGIETIQELHTQQPALKIVAISGGGSRYGVPFLEMAEKLGADATLSKPIDTGELVAVVARLVASETNSSEAAA